MPNNVAASMTASVVIDKKDIIAQVLSGISIAQKEIDNNKLEIFFDISDENVTKQLKEFQKKLRGKDFIIKLEAQGIEETFNNIESFLKRIDKINLNKTLGIGNGKGIGNSIVDEKSLQTIIDLFTKMENHLDSMKKVFADVGDGEEFSPLLKMINQISESIDKLSGSVKNIGLNMNIDLGSDNQMEAKIHEKTSKYLFAYKQLFEKLKLSGINDSFIVDSLFDFDKTIEQYDTSIGKIAAYEKMLKSLVDYSENRYGKNILKSDYNKGAFASLSSSKGQYTKAINELKKANDSDGSELLNLFGKTDLTEVISQLIRVVEELEKISSVAVELKTNFADGLNVTTSISEIEKLTNKVKELEEQLNKLSSSDPIKDTFHGEKTVENSAKNAEKAVKNENEAFKETDNVSEDAADAKKEFVEANKDVKKSADDSTESITEEKKALKEVQDVIKKAQSDYDKYSLKPVEQNRSYELNNKLSQMDNLIGKLHELETKIATDGYVFDNADTSAISNYREEIEKLTVQIKQMSAAEKGSTEFSRWKEVDKLSKYLEKNTRLSKEARRQLEYYLDRLKNGDASVNIQEIHLAWNKVAEAERRAGREGKRFLDIVSDKRLYAFAAQLGTMFDFYDFIQLGEQGIEVIRELDRSLTDMLKVSDEGVYTLKRFQDASFDLANSVGTTAKQIQDSTADWMRLGENLSDATNSASATNILKNVSEFESIDEATNALISMSQAYKDLEKMDIVDVLNHIGNEYSISTDGIATALQDSASALVTANNDLNEAVSLITTGNAVTQDPSKVGAGKLMPECIVICRYFIIPESSYIG